jgi:hypothetical protein
MCNQRSYMCNNTIRSERSITIQVHLSFTQFSFSFTDTVETAFMQTHLSLNMIFETNRCAF